MMRTDDFDRRFEGWLDAAAAGSTPAGLLSTIVAETQRRGRRPSWIVALRGTGMGSIRLVGRRVDPNGPVIRRLALALIVAGLTLALLAALLLAGIGRPAGPRGAIVFVKTDVGRTTNSPFIIGPDGLGERALTAGIGIPSPDGLHLLLSVQVADPSPTPGAPTAWMRPAIAGADGSSLTLLDAYPGRKMHLAPVAWSPDGSRVLVSSGPEAVLLGDVGIYTIRATDGGGLERLVFTPAGNGDVPIGYSKDGSQVLFSRVGNDPGVFVVGSDGQGVRRLSGRGWVPVDLDFWDPISADWSPDGSEVVFAASAGGATLALYVVPVNGGLPRAIVASTLGALSARWSPTGALIAFTSGHLGSGRTPAGKELIDRPQVWVVAPDGTGLRQLTFGADGSTSVTPVWAPDGSRLLFQRKLGDEVTLWTMRADGSDRRLLTPSPVAADYVGDFAWTTLAAPQP